MVRLAICDDEPKQCDLLNNLLTSYMAARESTPMKLSIFSSGEDLLAAVEESGSFDIYLLDIVMPGISGIELGVRLREIQAEGSIIYLSISPEFAVDSYAARAFYYLMKPPDPVQLFSVLDRAIEELEKQRSACITVKIHDGWRLLRMDQVMYAELSGRTVRYHLTGGEQVDSITVRMSFQDAIAPLLADHRFFLCGASFAANLHYVTAVERDCFVMDNGHQVPLSRGLAAQARQCWQDYWLEPQRGI